MTVSLALWVLELSNLYMRECVGNYYVRKANGNVEGVDKLAGAGILNFLNISHNRPLLVHLILAVQIVNNLT